MQCIGKMAVTYWHPGKMWAPLLLLSICLSVNCQVPIDPQPGSAEAGILHYVKHFRQIIFDYITTQYKPTEQDANKVSIVLDIFFRKLASDLNEVMNNNDKVWEIKPKLEDGLPDEKFEEIKKNIQQQYQEITDSSANEIIYRLRVNLYDTKLKLDQVMKQGKVVESKVSSEEYDS